jgi:hypothetical protein
MPPSSQVLGANEGSDVGRIGGFEAALRDWTSVRTKFEMQQREDGEANPPRQCENRP